jgi:hypothetical protein
VTLCVSVGITGYAPTVTKHRVWRRRTPVGDSLFAFAPCYIHVDQNINPASRDDKSEAACMSSAVPLTGMHVF